MTHLNKLRKAVAKEEEKIRKEDEYESLSKRLYELKNRKIIAQQKAKQEKFKRYGNLAKKFLRGAGKSVSAVGQDLNKLRTDKAINERLEKVHGIQKLPKLKAKKGRLKKRITVNQYEEYDNELGGGFLGGNNSGGFSLSDDTGFTGGWMRQSKGKKVKGDFDLF